MAEGKHVIFLGAGASRSSGYPVAAELTKLMADRVHFMNQVRILIAREITSGLPMDIALSVFDKYEPAARMLKEGSFATMDELSNLAFGGQRAGDVLQLKRLLRLVFGLDNPHVWHWGTSDYRNFINALFQSKEVPREDVCIVSLNYDPYLEFLLFSTLVTRHTFRGVADEKMMFLKQAVTSGFFDPDALDWLQVDGFSHLKLHGTAALPNTAARAEKKIFHWQHLFQPKVGIRYTLLRDLADQDPPVLLPWEIVHPQENRLLTEKEFWSSVGDGWQHLPLYPLFTGIWERARREVENARKISFIGMSMAALYEPELRYIFSGRQWNKPLQILSVNPSNTNTIGGEHGIPKDRVTPAGKLYHFLDSVSRRDPFAVPKIGEPREGFGRSFGFQWTYEFSEFISLHMD